MFYITAGPPYYQNPSKTTEVNEFMAEEICLSFGFCWKHLKSIDPQKMIEGLNIYHISQICGIFGSQILRYRHVSLLFGQHS